MGSPLESRFFGFFTCCMTTPALNRRQASSLLLGSLCLSSPLASPAATTPTITDAHAAINIAGKERGLSQRMAKAFLQSACRSIPSALNHRFEHHHWHL